MSKRIIDVWAQVPTGPEQLPEGIRGVFERAGTAHVLASGVDPDGVVGEMDSAGIATLCISAWHGPRGALISNDAVAACVERHPDRFVGVAAVDLERPMAALRELERAVLELGFRALRIVPWLWNRPPTDRLYYPLFARCVELGIPFCTQAGHTGPEHPSEPGRPIPYLDQVALDFPDLRIVAGHIGYPWTDEMIAVAWKHPNVYIDTSAWAPRYYPPSLRQFMRTYGREKVLFATNYPQMPLERCVREAHELELPHDVLEAFLGGNAERVFGLADA
jgi:uncharacterized protein